MSGELMTALAAVAQRLVSLSARDAGLRADLRALAEAVLAATEEPRPQAASAQSPLAGEAPVELPVPAMDMAGAVPVRTPVPETGPVDTQSAERPLPELTLGRSSPPLVEHDPGPAVSPKVPLSDAVLPAIEARCRLKAEGIRWAATRHRRLAEGADFRAEVAPKDREIVDRARQVPDCYLWMNSPDFTMTREPALLENVGGCFEAVADAVALVRGMLGDIEGHREFFEQALDVLAEAQSALRVAIGRIDGPTDPDQFRVYGWLRGTAAREQIYIHRHMRIDDPADPAHLPEIEARIEALDANVQGARQRIKRRKSRLNRLRYHVKLIGEGAGSEHDWRKVAEAIEEMVNDGVPPSNVEIREAVLSILDRMPDLADMPRGFALALREIDRYLATRVTPSEMAVADVSTAEIKEAARLLAETSVVLIGGSRRPDAHDALRTALGLKELFWIETREHESIDSFEPYIARPEVALVLLAIRWSSHSFGEVKRFCDRHGKPLVRLPAGYNPNQVALQILSQCSEQLGR